MKTLSTFVFVHDQEIILEQITSQALKNLEPFTYVFIGLKETDKIEKLDNVIIAKHLEYNLEQYNTNFLSFTGWYTLWKNGLLKTDYFNLFEYDVTIASNFYEIVQPAIETGYDFNGYIPRSVNLESYTDDRFAGKLIESIKKHYNIDIVNIVKANPETNWSSTSNSTFQVNAFNSFMLWFEKLIDDLKEDRMAGHYHERAISYFHILFNQKINFTTEILEHHFLNSHKSY